MGKIQRNGGITSAIPVTLLEREEFTDITEKVKYIGLPNGAKMTLPNIEPGTDEKPFPKWNSVTKRYEKVATVDQVGYTKKYVAKIVEITEGAPSISLTPLFSTFTGVPTIAILSTGVYAVTLTGEIVPGKTMVKLAVDYRVESDPVMVKTFPQNINSIHIEVSSALTLAYAEVSGRLNDAIIEIEIYP